MTTGKRAKDGSTSAGGTVRALATASLAAPDSFYRPPFNDQFALELLGRTFASAIDAFATAVFITDLDGLVVYLNPGAERISGSSPELARGRHIADLLYTPLNAELREHSSLLEAAMEQGHAAMRFAVPITSGDGQMQLIDYHAIPLTDEIGTLVGGLFVALDFRQPEGVASETA